MSIELFSSLSTKLPPSTIVQQHIDECYDRARERVQWLRQLESAPFTLNTHYLSDYKEKFLAYYKGAREQLTQPQHTNIETSSQNLLSFSQSQTVKPSEGSKPNDATGSSSSKFSFTLVPTSLPPTPDLAFPPPKAPVFPPTAVTALFPPPPVSQDQARAEALKKVLSGLAELGMSGITEADLPKLLPSDRMEPALGIMADVRAYFQGECLLRGSAVLRVSC